MPSTPVPARRQLHELDDQIRRCKDEIAATGLSADDDQRITRNLALGALTARRIVTLQWL